MTRGKRRGSSVLESLPRIWQWDVCISGIHPESLSSTCARSAASAARSGALGTRFVESISLTGSRSFSSTTSAATTASCGGTGPTLTLLRHDALSRL